MSFANCRASLQSVEHEWEDEVSELEEELRREGGRHHDGVRQLEDGAGPPDRVQDAEAAVEVDRHQRESENLKTEEGGSLNKIIVKCNWFVYPRGSGISGLRRRDHAKTMFFRFR